MIGVGLIVMLVLASTDHGVWRVRWLNRGLLLISLGLMAWTLRQGPGLLTGHICRWVNIGGFQLQPVEPAKLAAIVVMAQLLTCQPRHAPLGRRQVAAALLGGFLPLVTMLILQPNFGNVLVITGVTLVMLFVAGIPLRWLAGLTLVPGAGMALAFAVVPKLHERLTDWIAALGSGDYQYQV